MKTRRQRNTEGSISRPTLMLILAAVIAAWGAIMVVF